MPLNPEHGAEPAQYLREVVVAAGFSLRVATIERLDVSRQRQIVEWVGRHYVRIERIGAEPFRDGRFGIVILRRGGEAHPPDEGRQTP